MGEAAAEPTARQLGVALARELREIIEALNTTDVAADALTEALAHAREVRRNLQGERRHRWYEGEGAVSPSTEDSRAAFFDQSPLRGQQNPLAPPLHMEPRVREDGTPIIAGWARLGLAYEGPPHGVHGGVVAAMFDELLGGVQILAGDPGVTGKLRVTYRAITPLEQDLRFEGWIAQDRGRSLVARATCHAGDVLTADAEGLFVRVDFRELRRDGAF